MTLGSLFSGIGGFELAATWAGIKPVWSNEINPFCCKVLRKNFNHEIIEKDIREIGAHNLKPVDIISGGFPCQPFSTAGKRKGKSDDRYLWPEMLRVIRELKPSYVIGENVAGLLSMENGETLKGILSDLEDEGYNNEIFIIPASSVEAWHRRDRIWIIGTNGNTKSNTFNNGYTGQPIQEKVSKKRFNGGMPDTSHTCCQRLQGSEKARNNVENRKKSKNQLFTGCCGESGYWETEPKLGRVANGIPRRVDRLKGLGNAIVPQVAYELFKAIKTIND